MYDILGCILLALALYYNTLSAGFAYDDSRAILKNRDLLPETPLSQIFFDDFWGTPLNYSGSHKSYRPLCVVTFRLNYALGELNPFGYHLMNVLLHAVATALVTYVARVLFKRTFPTVLTGLLFASHPIHTEAVAGVVGRADVGACVLSLSSFLFYRNYCKFRDDTSTNSSESDTKSSKCLPKWLFLLASCLCSTLSMLTKEQGITVLAINVTFDTFVQHHIRLLDLFKIYKKQYRSLQAGIVSQLLCGGVLLSFRIIFMGRKLPDFSPADNPAANSDDLLTRILTFTYLPAFNLWMLLWPQTLSFDWSMEAVPLIVSFADTRNLATVAFYVGLAAIGYYCVKELNVLYEVKCASNMTKVNANHLTSLSSHKMGDPQHTLSNSTNSLNRNEHNRQEGLRKRLTLKNHQHLNEHNFHESCNEHYKANHSTRHTNVIIMSLAFMVFSFIPATNIFFYVGFVVAERILYIPSVGFCMLVATAIDQIHRKLTKFGKCAVVVMVIVQLLMYSSRTVLRNWDWHSEETLFRSGISVNPAKAWNNLANIFKSQGKVMEAEDAYRKALGYRGNMADAHNNLGILLQEDKRYNEAIASFKMAIECRPRMSIAHSNLGLAYIAIGRHKEAEAVFRQGATLYYNIGNADPKKQIHGVVSSLFNLGKLLHGQSRYEEALLVFIEAKDRRPYHYAPQALYSMLGETYFQLGKLVEAENYYKESLKAKPDYVPVHLSYANMLSKTNRFTEGERLLKRAIELEPTNSAVYRHYGYFYSNQGKHKEAASMFKRALTHHPNDYELTANLADALRQNQDGKQAEMYYKKAVEIQPDNANGHMNLGAMRHINNILKEAESSYLEALRLKPDDPATMQNLKNLRKLLAKNR